MDTKPDTKAVALSKVRKAQQHIQRAQQELGLACAELSNIIGALPDYNRLCKLYDRVHVEWYKVDALAGRRIDLDGIAKASLAKKKES